MGILTLLAINGVSIVGIYLVSQQSLILLRDIGAYIYSGYMTNPDPEEHPHLY